MNALACVTRVSAMTERLVKVKLNFDVTLEAAVSGWYWINKNDRMPRIGEFIECQLIKSGGQFIVDSWSQPNASKNTMKRVDPFDYKEPLLNLIGSHPSSNQLVVVAEEQAAVDFEASDLNNQRSGDNNDLPESGWFSNLLDELIDG